MSNISKITSVLLYALMAVSVILLVIFYKATAEMPDEADFDTQMVVYGGILDLFMYWAYALLIVAAVAAVAFPLVRMFTRPKEAVKTLISVAVVAVIVFIAYSLADDTVLEIIGYDGNDNNPGTLKFAGMILWTAYLLFFGTIASILYVEISKVFK
ncbi:MAG: hypothetical protein ABFS35_07465 [Bacteroidota bacterium]